MALEDLTGTKYIDDLNASNPAAGDNVSEGDDHIRGIKNVLKVTLPNVTGAVTPTHTELNYVDGVTSAIQTQLNAVTANDWVTTARINADAITGAEIADNAIDSEHYTDDSIDAAHLANSINTDIATGVTAGTTASAALPKAGGTMTGNIVSGDNVKATYGTSADLEIYHDGSNSIIHDNGTGNLLLKGDNLSLRSSGNESYVTGVANGAVSIYYDNSAKIDTTAAGATVTGVLTATLQANAIDSDHYVDGSIDNAHIADNAIDSEHYADGSIDNAHIADDAIDSEHYVDGSIDTAHIADNAITLAKMASGTDGNIISFDASGNPVAIATGSDGQVLTSAGAGQPPAFEAVASGGASDIDGLSDAKSAGTDFTGSLILGHQTTGTLDAAEYNTAVGLTAMDAITSGDANNCLGYNSLGAITTGSSNTAIGKNAMKLNTTGGNNIAIGQDAFWSSTTFSQNIAIGNNCMALQDEGIRNTVIGNYAFDASTGGNYNTIIGYSAATKATSTGCRNNTIVGTHAADDIDAGWQNTIMGYWAADGLTSGFKNTIIGGEAGNVTTGNYNICIGNVADIPDATADGQINIANVFRMQTNGDILLRPDGEDQNAFIYPANRSWSVFGDDGNWISNWYTGGSSGAQYYCNFRLYNNTQVGSITTNSSTTSYTTSSDYRLKENVNYTWDATTRLKQLKPARFNWIADETNTLQDGFLAHEVSDIVPVAVTGEKDAMEAAVLYTASDPETETRHYKPSDQEVIDGTKNAGDVKKAATKSIGDVKFPEQIRAQQIDESKLVSLLVKTVQELEARITALES